MCVSYRATRRQRLEGVGHAIISSKTPQDKKRDTHCKMKPRKQTRFQGNNTTGVPLPGIHGRQGQQEPMMAHGAHDAGLIKMLVTCGHVGEHEISVGAFGDPACLRFRAEISAARICFRQCSASPAPRLSCSPAGLQRRRRPRGSRPAR